MLFGLIFKTCVVLYENGDEVISMIFNASGTNNVNWFSQARLISSPWNDLKTSNGLQHFDIVGWYSRFFEVSGPYITCQNDSGWMIITGGSCEWETRVDVPGIQYSKLANNVSWNDYGKNHWERQLLNFPSTHFQNYLSETIVLQKPKQPVLPKTRVSSPQGQKPHFRNHRSYCGGLFVIRKQRK